MLIVNPKAIVAEMLRQGVGVGELAKKACVSPSSISKITNYKGVNGRPTSIGIAGKISKALNVNVNEILQND